ncbi:flagellar biosynthetic protein FliR [Caldalkalibacillus uzonensis]|uniref:Flagellar biosynthetic protein FliR n=1 Tax=Caldalkalibacillus uzonensis TaxID=353224 RepID=A0ABU0CMF5_9BACI|nr:flagellar biosynthetic protein FliR [Caldalkalibacillus uzonensis]MDQ0337278.1 flagellar biosynthetic protein FliR [Caldalkalibacillus uzonensis]
MLLEWLNLLPVFLLILVRLTTFFVAAPLFSMQGVPHMFKIGLACFIALVSLTSIEVGDPIPWDLSFLFYVGKEALVGLALGFVAALVIYTVQVAGAFIDFQMGFLIANLVDPQTGAQVPIIGNLKYFLTLLFLLSVDAHHLLIEGVIRSYQLVPIDQYMVEIGSAGVAQLMTHVFVQMFVVALLIALPVVGALFLVDISLGILARTVPQINVFVVGLPLKIFSGFVLILITLPGFFYLLHRLVGEMVNTMGQLLRVLG